MKLKIALVGNPNSGKTTLFNDLTGSSQYVGNWPGVTVERKEGLLKGYKDVIIQDLPGIYSLSAYSTDEIIARNYLFGQRPDAIINVVDGSNLERNLYLTTQLLELGIPMVVAVNMIDVVEKRGDEIDVNRLSEVLGCKVVATSAAHNIGSLHAAKAATIAAVTKEVPTELRVFDDKLEYTLDNIQNQITGKAEKGQLRWMALKLFEQDSEITAKLNLDVKATEAISEQIKACEQHFADDSESILAAQRYNYVANILKCCVSYGNNSARSLSDNIDKVVTNKYLALPIFALVMFLVYYLSVTTLGGMLTDFTNDTIFAETILPAVSDNLEVLGVAPWLVGLITDGIVGGVGAVLGFVPQMVILFVLLAMLEECGYMARVAFIMDRIFRGFGLCGKSFISMLVGSGCSVPAIMAARTIEREEERKLTVMTTAFIPCSAKMPVIALIAGALFGGAWWMAPLAYFVGVAAVIISAVLLKNTLLSSNKSALFIMELPEYHMPKGKNVWRSAYERSISFVKRAGTVVLLSSVVLWFLQGFAWIDGGLQAVDDNNVSLLAYIGQVVAPIFAPLGFGSWKPVVGTITGLIAKENVVGTLGVLYGFAEVAEDGMEYWTIMAQDFTQLSAFSFLLFNLLCAPCFAAIGAIKREMGSNRWTLIAVGYMTAFAYSMSFIIYQLGLAIEGNGVNIFTIIALVLLGAILALLMRSKSPALSYIAKAKAVNV